MPEPTTQAKEPKFELVWTFHYHVGNEKRVGLVRRPDIGLANTEFHAQVQLVGGVDRDGYTIDRVESNHVTMGTPSPQVYLKEDLPARNPLILKDQLPEPIHNRLFPKPRVVKSATKEVKA